MFCDRRRPVLISELSVLILNPNMLLLTRYYCCVCLQIQDHPVSKTSQIQRSGAESHGCFRTDDGLGLCEQRGTPLFMAKG